MRTAARPTSLDNVFRAFYEAHVGKGDGFTTEQLKGFFEALQPGASALIERAAQRPGELRVRESLEALGFGLETRKVKYVGVVLKENTGPELSNVLDSAPAAEVGLAPGDELLDLEGQAFDLKTLKWLIAQGKSFELRVRRGGRTLQKRLVPSEREELSRLWWNGNQGQLKRIGAWLGRDDLSWKEREEIPLAAFDNFHGIQAVV
jgi:predicted metalloprotease with PDZ domain